MRNFKLLIAGIVVSFFFLTTNVNAQATSENDTKFHFEISMCAGDLLIGCVDVHTVVNKNFKITNFKGDLYGLFTGEMYTIIGNTKLALPVDCWYSMEKGINVRLIGEDGLVYHKVLDIKDGEWSFRCK